MKKREFALALSLLGMVSAVCIKGMKAVGEKIAERTRREEADRYRKTEE